MAHSDGLRRADDKLQRRDPGAGGMICHDRNRTGSPMATIGRAASQKGGRKSVEWSIFRQITTRPTHITWGGYQRADPIEWGWQNRSSAAPTTSAGGQGPSRGQDFGGPSDGCRGWRSGGIWTCAGVEEAGRDKQNVPFLLCPLFFSFVWRAWGGGVWDASL